MQVLIDALVFGAFIMQALALIDFNISCLFTCVNIVCTFCMVLINKWMRNCAVLTKYICAVYTKKL